MTRLSLSLAAMTLPLAVVAQTPSKTPPPPTLVVFLTVDQMRSDYFQRFLPQLDGGLGRLYRHGAFFTRAYQDHAITETAPGHSTVLSGRFPRHTGIVTNSAGVLDVETPLVAMNDTGASPFRFRGSTLIDWMRVKDWRSRALSVSRKDRAAILPIGRAHQTAVWFVANGNFTTSTYYSDTLPTWLSDFNAKRLPLSFAGTSWKPLLPDSAYPEPDTVATESGGKDYVFPHKLPRDSTVMRALQQTPMMDQLTLEVALAGVRAMKLGEGPVPDLLAISLSSTDAVGHRYGPDSKELHDQIVRLDQYLGAFLDSLYAMRDSSRVVIALTADHGVAPYPEVHSGRYPNKGAGYVNVSGFFEYIRQAVGRKGIDTTAWRFSEGCLYVDRDKLSAGGVSPDSLERVFTTEVKAVPGVARIDVVKTLAQKDTIHDFVARRWFHMFPDDVAPELVVTLKPYWYWGEPGGSASHGSVYDYDAWVPVLFYGPAFKPGKYTTVVRTVDMAPTLANVVGAKPTEKLDGHVLWEALSAPHRPTVVAAAGR
ncbi:MAG TPA: alkaline phosphatase family protein [Gemmatimonadaceae bacterium]|nr:alkaline phosphatase family protein [Gemmatimonadaceae bacterium]